VFAGFRYALAVLALLSLALLLLPLLAFAWDALRNPGCLTIRVEGGGRTAEGELRAKVSVSYCSSVPLKDVRVRIGSRTVEFGRIARGVYTQEVTLTLKDLEEGIRELEASIGGLYRMAVRFG